MKNRTYYYARVSSKEQNLDRLSRNKIDIRNELQYFKDTGIRVKIIDLPTTMMDLSEGQEWVFDMVNNILIEVLGTIAQQERITIHQRQAEGIAAARAKGKYLGRPRIEYPENWDDIYSEWQSGNISAVEAMKMLGMKKSSFYKLAKIMR